VLFWDTLAAQMDEDGTPHPVSGTFSPCGRGGDETISECQNP
jgi:poly-gamma-glutamate synthesis protein (capsule biosynthesis protein)